MKALIVGATGLVGSQLLKLLIHDSLFTEVCVVSRKPIQEHHPKLQHIVVDFSSLENYRSSFAVDTVFCCLGTTMKKAKTKQAFYEVDYIYSLQVATLAKESGVQTYCLVSALGASVNSAFYYNQVKGQLEIAVQKLSFSSLYIFRPALLLGDRMEHRPGEAAGQFFFKALGWVIPKRFRAIDSSKVAKAMLVYGKAPQNGVHFIESSSIQSF